MSSIALIRSFPNLMAISRNMWILLVEISRYYEERNVILQLGSTIQEKVQSKEIQKNSQVISKKPHKLLSSISPILKIRAAIIIYLKRPSNHNTSFLEICLVDKGITSIRENL